MILRKLKLSIAVIVFLSVMQPIFAGGEILRPKDYRPPVFEKSSRLQIIVDNAVKAMLASYPDGSFSPNDVAVTVIDLRNPDKLLIADYRGEAAIYPASVVKMFYMAALERQLEDGKIRLTPELSRGLRDMIVGFEVGWLYWIVRVATFAANCNLFVTYLGFFDRRFDDPSIRSAAIIMVVLALAVINLIGVRQSAIASNIFTAGKLIPLILFSVVGLFFISPDNFHFDTVPEYGNFSGAVLLLLYAFVGFEMAVVLGGETKDPQHSVPFALLVAVGAVAVLYILIQVVSIGTLPNLSASERPLADAASTYMGYFGAGFITIGALISILGNLNVGILGSTRLLFAMSERGDLPLFLSQVHNRFRTPHLSIAVTITAMLLLTLYSSFLSALAIATITRLLVYATTCAALPVFRRRGNSPPARFKSPAGNIVVVLSLLLIIWLLTRVDLQKEALPIAVAGVIGLVIFAARRLLSRVKNV